MRVNEGSVQYSACARKVQWTYVDTPIIVIVAGSRLRAHQPVAGGLAQVGPRVAIFAIGLTRGRLGGGQSHRKGQDDDEAAERVHFRE